MFTIIHYLAVLSVICDVLCAKGAANCSFTYWSSVVKESSVSLSIAHFSSIVKFSLMYTHYNCLPCSSSAMPLQKGSANCSFMYWSSMVKESSVSSLFISIHSAFQYSIVKFIYMYTYYNCLSCSYSAMPLQKNSSTSSDIAVRSRSLYAHRNTRSL